MLATFMILVRFFDLNCRNASAAPPHQPPEPALSGRECRGSPIAPIAATGAARQRVRKPQPVLDQDVLDKDINALNGTTDVETEN